METKNDKTKDTIQTFFNLDASPRTTLLFAKWFVTNKDEAGKDEAMQAAWESSSAEADKQTRTDWQHMKNRLRHHAPRKRNVLLRAVSYVAAIAALIAMTIYATYTFAVPEPLEYTQISVPYGESQKFTLSDGTVIAINSGSTLIFPKSFTSNTRTVFLTGEANFDVAKNPDKPFIVKTQHAAIEALGTKYSVQAYPENPFTKATLIEGCIRVDIPGEADRSFTLKPDNQLIYSHNDKAVSVIQVDAAKLASWEKGYLIFQGASFKEITQALERKYDVEIFYDGHIKPQSYHVKFTPDESLADALDVLTMLIEPSHYKINGERVYFYFQ